MRSALNRMNYIEITQKPSFPLSIKLNCDVLEMFLSPSEKHFRRRVSIIYYILQTVMTAFPALEIPFPFFFFFIPFSFVALNPKAFENSPPLLRKISCRKSDERLHSRASWKIDTFFQLTNVERLKLRCFFFMFA